MKDRSREGNSSSRMDDELDIEELVALGKEAGISHPYVFQGSPFFGNITKEQILEVANPTPDQRPFSSLPDLSLHWVNAPETKFPN